MRPAHAGCRQVSFETSEANRECYRRKLESEIAAGKVVLVDTPLPSIDETVARLHLARVDYINMDWEASEEEMAGAHDTLTRFHPRPGSRWPPAATPPMPSGFPRWSAPPGPPTR